MEHGTIVGIQATIWTMVVGALVGYGIYLSGELNAAERKVITEASKINEIEPGCLLPPLNGKYNDADFHTVVAELCATVQKAAGTPAQPTVDADAADHVADLLTVLTDSYPFRSPFGKKRGYFVTDKPTAPKVEFSGAEDVRAWLSDLDYVITGAGFVIERHHATLTRILKAARPYVAVWSPEALKQLKPNDQQRIIAMISPTTTPTQEEANDQQQRVADYQSNVRASHAFQQIARAGKISEATKAELFQYDLYRKRLPTHRAIRIWAGVLSVAFVGIVLPMFRPQRRPWLVLWLPTACYLVILAYVVVNTVQ